MTETIAAPGKRPLAVYAIIERKDAAKPPIWLKVGAAFPNRDGSLTLLLDAFPTCSNRLQVREQRPFDEAKPTSHLTPVGAEG